MFLFSTELPIAMGITTRRLAIIIAIGVLLLKKKQTMIVWRLLRKQKMSSFFICLLLVTLISLFHYFSRDQGGYAQSFSEPWYFIYIILFILVFSLYCAVEFRSLKEFVFVLVCVYLFQTVIVLRSLVDASFRTHIYESYNNLSGDDRFMDTIERGTRIVGINLAGAAGSVAMSTGALGLVALKVSGKIRTLWFWLLYAIIMVGTVFVGRTGILVEIGLLLPILLQREGRVKNLFYVALFAGLLVIVIMYVLSQVDPLVSEQLVYWMTESFDSSDRARVNEGVLQGGIPPFSVDFIFGTGLETGYSANGVLYTSDSGLIRTYMSYGIVGFILYYMAMFKLLTAPKLRMFGKHMRFFFCVCILIAFIIEYKEPFMMKYIFPQAILACMLLYSKDSMITADSEKLNSMKYDKTN